ncbi:MAG: tetratricopeptide repeat protein [Micropruina glycogenica]
MGQRDEAIRLLRQEIELIGARGPKSARARLRYYFAHLLAESGDTADAEEVVRRRRAARPRRRDGGRRGAQRVAGHHDRIRRQRRLRRSVRW